jgi:hypothetical protein
MNKLKLYFSLHFEKDIQPVQENQAGHMHMVELMNLIA